MIEPFITLIETFDIKNKKFLGKEIKCFVPGYNPTVTHNAHDIKKFLKNKKIKKIKFFPEGKIIPIEEISQGLWKEK